MRKILVTSLKGGVGKTTVSVQLAYAFLRRGNQVGILDLDYRTPNVPVMMDDQVKGLDHSFNGDILIPPEIDGIKVMSMAYIWPAWKCVQVPDDQAMDDVIHLLKPDIVRWGNLDFLIVDTPPTSVGVVEVALKADDILGAILVSHASRVARMDAIRTIDLFREREVPILGMVCNQVGLHDLTVEDMEEIARANNLPLFVAIPHVRGVELATHFDSLAEKLLAVKPVILKVAQVEDKPWRALLKALEMLSGRKNS